MSAIPECEYRAVTEDPRYFFCRHQRIHANNNIVSKDFCAMCSDYDKPCDFPRPHPHEISDSTQRFLPPLGKRLWNLAVSLRDFVADGLTTVSGEEYQLRLEVCESCENRIDNYCTQCGCSLTLKAHGRAFQCPLGKWETDMIDSEENPLEL